MNIDELKKGKKSTIEEIIVKYKRAKIKKIYVEGSTDKALIQLFLKKSEIKNIVVLRIETVDIPKELIEEQKLELEYNNRNRVIVLSLLIQEGMIGIIDSDFDFIEEPIYTKPLHLLSTDYSDMEIYGFNEDTLEKIFLGYPSKQAESYPKLLNMISDILLEIFLIRFAKKKIEPRRSHIDFLKKNKDFLSLNLKKITFDRDIYLKKYVSDNASKVKEFNNFIEEKKSTLSHDIRKVIHGHDYVDLLMFYLEVKDEKSRELFRRLFYSFFDFNLLKEEKMFKDLIKTLTVV